MKKQKLHSDSVVGLRYRGNSLGLPSVSIFRSGHMPSGMNVSRVIESLSASDMDTSDSEGEHYGAPDSLEASSQDDKVANGGVPHNAFVNGANYDDRVVGRGGGNRGSAYDESCESVTSSEVNSTPASSSNGVSVEKRYNAGVNLSSTCVQPNKQTLKQDLHNVREQDNFSDDDTPSAPPLAGSFQQQNQVYENLPTVRADANPRSATSAVEIESNKYKGMMSGAAEVKTSEMSARNAAASSRPIAGR